MFRIPQSRYFFVVFLYIFKALAQYELKNEEKKIGPQKYLMLLKWK